MRRPLLLLDSPLYESVSSTQEICRALAERGAPEGTTVRAREQTSGRGRGSRRWHSPPGQGLWMSFLLRPSFEPAAWPALTALVALEAARALERLCHAAGTGALEGMAPWRCAIKWPNDLQGRQGKLGGILAETSGDAVIIGTGINLSQRAEAFPPELRARASSLFLEGFEAPPDPATVAEALNEELTPAYAGFSAGDRAFLREGLRERFFLRGARVRVEGQGGRLEGTARDLGPLGELLLETPSGTRAVISGEIESFDLGV